MQCDFKIKQKYVTPVTATQAMMFTNELPRDVSSPLIWNVMYMYVNHIYVFVDKLIV